MAQAPVPVQCETSGVGAAGCTIRCRSWSKRGRCWQAPRPSHVPSNPQGGAAVQRAVRIRSRRGDGLAGPRASRNVAGRADRRSSAPSSRRRRRSCRSRIRTRRTQNWPSRLCPQEPRAQMLPGAQSASVPQAALQVAPLQAYAPQDWVVAGLHTPRPSQVRGRVADRRSDRAGAGGAAGARRVELAGAGAVAKPGGAAARRPCVGAGAGRDRCPRPAPASRSPACRSPRRTCRLPVQAVAQQTPWAQVPLPHSVPAAQIGAERLEPAGAGTAGGGRRAVGVGGAGRIAGRHSAAEREAGFLRQA